MQLHNFGSNSSLNSAQFLLVVVCRKQLRSALETAADVGLKVRKRRQTGLHVGCESFDLLVDLETMLVEQTVDSRARPLGIELRRE